MTNVSNVNMLSSGGDQFILTCEVPYLLPPLDASVTCVCVYKSDRQKRVRQTQRWLSVCGLISQPPVCSAGRNSHGRTSGRRMADQ